MRISFVEVQNFRKLQAVRIDFSVKTTLLIGANNSGKTSAMVALGHFLYDRSRFTTNDFTLSNWARANAIGNQWESEKSDATVPSHTLVEWETVLPSLDVWLEVKEDEFHHVSHLLPLLDWSGGLLGVRLRLEPKQLDDFHKEYLVAATAAKETIQAATKANPTAGDYTLNLWPQNMRDFLDRNLGTLFTVRAYSLDPSKCKLPVNGVAQPQPLPSNCLPMEGDPLKGLIRVDEINAQRGLGDAASEPAGADGQESSSHRQRRKLSEQLKSYYSKHLDPSEFPEPSDLDALQAIANAQKLFDDRLESGFSEAIKELECLNYPGVTDPKLKIATKVLPTDGLNHNAAVQYEVLTHGSSGGTSSSLRLPEEYNGLGYQNLISMVFRLMSFRDGWMCVGKAAQRGEKAEGVPPRLHLVLVEEPEAHLHAQVQQVFIKKAYDVLRKHDNLGEKPTLQTQLIVSTHSSHMAHECEFSCMRYFRRLPAIGNGNVPTSAVINLSEVFGPNDETEKFVTRYLRATHCDLFFADAAILVEGSAERILMPHFISTHFTDLHRCYVTLLEIDGSHAHRLRPLIEHLGLTTLIVTDIDSVEPTGNHEATAPRRGATLLTGNPTLKEWHPITNPARPLTNSLDVLLDLPEQEKVKHYDIPLFSIRVAYQVPIPVVLTNDGTPVEVLSTTFEDSLVLENLSLFKTLDGTGLIKRFKDAIAKGSTATALSEAMFDALSGGRGKAAFALDLLWLKDPTALKVPRYISNGLAWLEQQVRPNQVNVLPVVVAPALTGGPQ